MGAGATRGQPRPDGCCVPPELGALVRGRHPSAGALAAGFDHSEVAGLAIHHSRDLAETNSNYGNVLTVYDRRLGTFMPSDRAVSVVYGLDEAAPTQIASFGGLLSLPFQAKVQPSLTQKSGSASAYTDNIPA